MTRAHFWLTAIITLAAVAGMSASARSQQPPRADLVLVVGAAGTEEFAPQFAEWAQLWTAAAQRGGVNVIGLGTSPDAPASLEKFKEVLAAQAVEKTRPLWLVFIGHGTYDGKTARYNLPGPDLSAQELASLLRPVERPTALLDCTSASGHFLLEISTPGRVVLTGTSSGNELSFARYGRFLAEAIGSVDADLDKDQQTSLLEAFLRASRLTAEFYTGEGRLATEHAALDDNGDSRMVEAEGFDGLLPIRRNDKPDLLPDGLVAHQWHLVPSDTDARLSPETIARRNELERLIASLRQRKKEMTEDEYLAFLEPLCLELAKIVLEPQAAAAQRQ